ncbi:anti-sigma F factor [Porcipelethomonas sp.]|uniref:anti-sigma F factor n=1 Tax=Porcipelethomonas sp. TaxID=2981675 RepID=UPI003EF51383
MEILNEMKISFKSKSENEGFARTAVCAFAALLDPGIEEIADIRTAVSEAVTNCIVHAYRGTEGLIEITARILKGNEIYIKIKDKGCGIPDVEQAMEPLYTTAPYEERAGLGFAVMESFMDSLKVKSTVGRGTVVTMRKRLGTADE